MSHYFTKNPEIKSELRLCKYELEDLSLDLYSDSGTFSAYHLDIGTRALLETILFRQQKVEFLLNGLRTILEKEDYLNCLDLGCGNGVISLFLQKYFLARNNLKSKLSGIDINERSILCAQKNALYHKLEIDFFSEDAEPFLANKKDFFDFIITNPPIRVGKEKMYQLISKSLASLKDKGFLLVVIGKKQGSDSFKKWLKNQNLIVNVLNKSHGFDIILINKIDKM